MNETFPYTRVFFDLPNEVNIKLIQASKERGVPKKRLLAEIVEKALTTKKRTTK